MKHYLGRVVFGLGMHRLFLHDKALVVAFHTIGEHGKLNSIQVTPTLFRKYCQFFKQHFEVVSLGDLLANLREGRNVGGKLVITFDDGYRDNYAFAAAELERVGLPATFFVTTDFIGSATVPRWDEDADVKSEWMTWDEVIDLDQRGFDIGAHTKSHVNLRLSAEKDVRDEVEGSKAVIEEKLGHDISNFAYPYGRRSDMTDYAKEIVFNAGFDCCVSCYGGSVSSTSDSMDLPRVPINDWYISPYQFGLDVLRPFQEADGEYGQPESADEKILIVSYHLYPDAAVGARRPSELMRFLADKGHDVEALSASLGKTTAKDEELAERIKGLEVMRVVQPPSITDWLWKHLKRLFGYARPKRRLEDEIHLSSDIGMPDSKLPESVLDKLRRHYNSMYSLYDARKTWALLAVCRSIIRRFQKRYDIIISSGPPSAAHIVGYLVAKMHGAKYVMDFRDPWVGNSQTGEQSNSWVRDYLEGRMESACCNRADLIIATTPGIKRMLELRYADLSGGANVVYNGFDGIPNHSSRGSKGRLDMLYAGTLYLNRNPFPFLNMVQQLVGNNSVDRQNVTFTLIGECSTWRGLSLISWVEEHNLQDVVAIFDRVTASKLAKLTEKSSVLINFAQGQPDQVPAKTYEHLAVGKEMIIITESDSDTASVIRKAGHGHIVSDIDPDSAMETLLAVYRGLVDRENDVVTKFHDVGFFSRETQNEIFYNFLDIRLENYAKRAENQDEV